MKKEQQSEQLKKEKDLYEVLMDFNNQQHKTNMDTLKLIGLQNEIVNKLKKDFREQEILNAILHIIFSFLFVAILLFIIFYK